MAKQVIFAFCFRLWYHCVHCRGQRCGRITFSAARPSEGLAPILGSSLRVSRLTLFPVPLLEADFSETQAAKYLEFAVKPDASFQSDRMEQITYDHLGDDAHQRSQPGLAVWLSDDVQAYLCNLITTHLLFESFRLRAILL